MADGDDGATNAARVEGAGDFVLGLSTSGIWERLQRRVIFSRFAKETC